MPVVAATWRVVLGVGSHPYPLPVNVKALAACLRVDSYFCPSLIPSIQVAATVSSCNVSFLCYLYTVFMKLICFYWMYIVIFKLSI